MKRRLLENPVSERALGFWRGLAARERMVLAFGIGAAMLLLLYGLAWAPLQRDLARLRTAVPEAQQQLAWMRAQAPRVRELRAASPSRIPGGGLLSFVEQSAQEHDIREHIRRVDPEGTDAVRLAVDEVGFNSLVQWLASLESRGGVRIETASLEPLSSPGLVNARLLLRAGS